MAEEGAKLTGMGKALSVLLIVGLVAGGGYLVYSQFLSGNGEEVEQPVEALGGTPDWLTEPDYKWVAADRLPEVKGVSGYTWDESAPVLRFSYNVWAGWLPVIAANHGTQPNEESVFYKKYGFKVELVLMDDPVVARDAFAAGEVHTLWGTLDMHVLFSPGLVKDSRSSPRIVQLVDWSSGGDGIVVRDTIGSVADLRGKSIAFAQNSPSEYYLNSLIMRAGLKPADVDMKYTATAFEAAAAFVADRSIDACVSWAPDIYNIPDRVKGTRLLSTTADASKLIADVYAVRADFVRDHPDVVQGLIAGIFEGMDMIKSDPSAPAKWMADAFGMQPKDVLDMTGDFHATNFAENMTFFLNRANPTNLEQTWKHASRVYRGIGKIDSPVPFDKVMDFTFLQNLEKAGTFAHQKDESKPTFTPGGPLVGGGVEAPLLVQTIRINFYPNSANPYEPARDKSNKKIPGKLYDPNAEATLLEVANLAGQFERANILIEGHTDSSMQGKGVPLQAVRDLSLARAEAIKQALIEKHNFDPNKFTVKGAGWDRPADAKDPYNQALNRRVEIGVFPTEQD